MKRIFSLLIGLIPLLTYANPSWRVHTTFDEAVTRIIDTGKSVYFTSRTQAYTAGSKYNSTEFLSLFRYDKDADEVVNLSSDNLLASNVVSRIEYSPSKGMLVVVHQNNDIDFLYDDGRAVNLPDYRYATTDFDKKVNSIFIDNDADRVYLSTQFGYVALNSKKLEVAESRNYGAPISAMTRIGDRIILLQGNRVLSAPVSAPRLSLSDYEEGLTLNGASAMPYLSNDISLVIYGNGSLLGKMTLENGKPEVKQIFNGVFYNPEYNSSGVTIPSGNFLFQFYPDATYKAIERERADWSTTAVGSHDMSEIWHGHTRRGIWSKRAPAENGGEWIPLHGDIRPNSPAPYMVWNMEWHPTRGLLVANHGYTPAFPGSKVAGPLLLSGYKDGFWSNLSPVYTNYGCTEALRNPNGIAVDPDNPDLVYFGSYMCGMERINMSDGTDVIHLSRKDDPYKNNPGFVQLVEGMPAGGISPLPGIGEVYYQSCPFAAPRFDYYGNLWTAFADYYDQNPVRLHLYCWEAADRKATTGVDNIRLPKRVEVIGRTPANREIVVPLMTSKHRNLLAYTQRAWSAEVVIIDTGGTPTDNSDDKVYSMKEFVDQDGNQFDVYTIRFLWEDTTTGYVWVGHEEGVFYFNPSNMIAGNNRVNRVKVARNDGTNLADYLLDGVTVNGMAADGRGRKWFATAGGGVVVTSADGRSVEHTYTTDNSPLPDDIVYSFGYIPTSNSMMIGTSSGLVEYFIPGDASGVSGDNVKVYPNPVRPEYAGYINIEGLPDNCLVKIVDASGNLVKELGVVTDGKGRWDGTNTGFRKVSSGVYFVLCSSAETDGSYANVGKVLVVN